MIPFRLSFEPGVSLYEQVVYAAKKAMISGQMRPGDPFPSVRALSKALKINPNTAHKVVTQLVSEGLIEVRPGLGTVVAELPASTAAERGALLKKELEQLVVEAKRLGLDLYEVTDAVARHWSRLEGVSPLATMRREKMSDAICATDLVKRFRSVRVLDGLSLTVPEGSVFGLAGPNGAGKTTTIKILMNIIRPTTGHAEVLGVDSRALGPEALANIGYVSENQEMPEWMTVEYLLAYLKPFYPAWDDARASQLVRQFDLPLDRQLRHLSRGMRMKTMLASSLAYRPRLLIMDEPFSGLDPLVREDLIDGLLETAGETTILISSHDLGEIESFASHIGYLDRGRLQFSEEMTSLTARFREVEVVVDSPPLLPLDRPWPAHWLRPETAPALVRFVETHFDQERTTADIRQLFGDVRSISAHPMPLRAIFVTLARAQSKAA